MDKYRRALFKYMSEYNVGQIEIGAKLGISHTTVGRWISGVNRIPPKHYKAIEKIVGFDPDAERCPLEEYCPVFTNKEVDHLTAEILDILSEIDKEDKFKILRSLRRYRDKSA